VADGSLLRLIGKCLHVGVLDGADYTEPEQGTIQGSGLSPLLGISICTTCSTYGSNGRSSRACSASNADQVCGRSADYVRESGRCEARDGSTRQADGTLRTDPTVDKTRLLPFRRPPSGQSSGKGPATFDFLGFTMYFARAKTEGGGCGARPVVRACERTVKSIADWCRGNRHKPVKVQHEALCRRIQGHYNYFGVSGNFRCLLLVQQEVRRAWFKWLRRRSQRTRLIGEVFGTTQAFPSSDVPVSVSESGAPSHEPHRRRSRMVEIS